MRWSSYALPAPKVLAKCWPCWQSTSAGALQHRRSSARCTALTSQGARARPTCRSLPRRRAARAEYNAIAHLGARQIFADPRNYPPLLAFVVLAVLTDPGLLSPNAMALAGGRNASANGPRMAGGSRRRLGAIAGGGIRPHPRHRRGRTKRCAAQRAHNCRRGGRVSPFARARRTATPHRLIRRRPHRGVDRHKPAGARHSEPESDHRRPVAGRRSGGRSIALGQPGHGTTDPGGRPRAVRSARLAAGLAFARCQRPDPPGHAHYRYRRGRTGELAGPPTA
jgi:hypothetical protein